jgi:uncharacterized membrane protein
MASSVNRRRIGNLASLINRPGQLSPRESRMQNWRSDILIPAGLLLLSAVPIIAGTARLVELAGGVSAPTSARFFDAPVPVVLHIVSVIAFSILGALQFWPGSRRRGRRWHRIAGRLVVPTGLISAATGIWMTLYYDLPPMDGKILNAIRLAVGVGMFASLCLGYAAIRRRDVRQHSAWMIRAYALGLGAGTQVLTHLPWFILVGQPDVAPRTVMMGGAWAINLAVAEYVIRRRRGMAMPVPARR